MKEKLIIMVNGFLIQDEITLRSYQDLNKKHDKWKYITLEITSQSELNM